MRTFVIAALLVLGALGELYGLLTIARDVRDAAATTEAIAAESETVMAANKHVVSDWISRATVGTIGDLSRRRI